MAHVATRVLPLRATLTMAVTDARLGETTTLGPAVPNQPVPIPSDLEAAYGVISGLVFGLLGWVVLLLPALYFLL